MKVEDGSEDRNVLREVVIGRNSKIWRKASDNRAVAERINSVIGHDEVFAFPFTARDRVWVFSYSRKPAENSRLFAALEAAAVQQVVYVSTATTIVTRFTRCYGYPTAKQTAENEARRRLDARILVLGLVVDRVEELPPGLNVATLQSAIEEFLLAPRWPEDGGRSMRLFESVAVSFTRLWEARLYRAYDDLQWMVRYWPCVLRPLDVLLRAVGIRWYGYVNLSNRLWNTTTS
jgi:hypothetical protein